MGQEDDAQGWDFVTQPRGNPEEIGSLSPGAILKGFQHLAQGCAPRATLGAMAPNPPNPEWVASRPHPVHSRRPPKKVWRMKDEG